YRAFFPSLSLVILMTFFLAQLWLHQYIFLYADDLYYSRDAQYGLNYLPYFIIEQLNLNGRVWVATAMFFVLKHQIYLFRILNPIILLLTVIILAKMSSFDEKIEKTPYWGVSLLCGCLFFLYLPLPIAHTTIYYAACAFNYLYPMTLALLYGYWLYTAPLRRKIPLLFLSFFLASSTQQVGMIGIGYTVMIAIYLSYMIKRFPISTFIPYFFLQLIGYTILSYGSFQRLLSEKAAGNEAALGEVVSELIRTNIFSLPAAPFVALICLSCIFWLWHRDYSANPFNRFLGFALSLATIGYLYLLLNENTLLQLQGENTLALVRIAALAFILIYLFTILYVSYLFLRRGQTPFHFFNSINAIGAQLMLLVVDARFAAAYKVMFPSLLLLSVFIFYSIATFRRNFFYLVLALSVITLLPYSPRFFSHYHNLFPLYTELLPWYPLTGEVRFVGFLVTLIVVLVIILVIVSAPNTPFKTKLLSQGKKNFSYALGVLFILYTLAVFSQTIAGYYLVSIPQNYNLQAIASYHEKGREGELVLKKVPVSYYGYNLGNWQTMPHFLKECYKIKEDTPIRYLE
ncbi:MAG: hypothetical protein GX958_12615, partial [Desulfitobacterium sp.]|nr:hypothetical protein [Desulfitobacterium sp.]